ncbi:MAG: FAD-binding oxidoreductase, partial [Candidatus Promineifilaceae bacterium]|nr:FAD-binding oxidoreductase [Candidatus Promineifilaceae bacterium]
MEMMPVAPTAIERWALLRGSIAGEVIAPEDAGYDQARLAWNLSVDQHPEVIVVPAQASDVLTAVQFASDHDLGVAVQATGHGVVRPADKALLILTYAMDEVSVNPAARTATIAAGAKWGKVLQMSHAYGLTPLLGSSPEVGAVGYTLGGGFGWLGRKFGLSLDSVNYFDVVTADGRAVTVSESEYPDLFWGMRGGGGSLAIVTGMEVKLYPVTTVYGGNLYYPIDQAQDVFKRYRTWIHSAPEELTSSIL